MAALTPEALTIFRQHLQTFVSFSDLEWALFSEHFYLRELEKRDLFIASGKICHEVGFILSGSFRFFYLKDGAEISNYFCFGAELISSYKSFLKKEPSVISIEAMEDAVVICFSQATLEQLLQNPITAIKMERFGRLVAEYLICCYEDRLVSFVTQTPEERYQHLIRQQPDLLQSIPQHYIANYLGITPVSLSRIRKRILVAEARKEKILL